MIERVLTRAVDHDERPRVRCHVVNAQGEFGTRHVRRRRDVHPVVLVVRSRVHYHQVPAFIQHALDLASRDAGRAVGLFDELAERFARHIDPGEDLETASPPTRDTACEHTQIGVAKRAEPFQGSAAPDRRLTTPATTTMGVSLRGTRSANREVPWCSAARKRRTAGAPRRKRPAPAHRSAPARFRRGAGVSGRQGKPHAWTPPHGAQRPSLVWYAGLPARTDILPRRAADEDVRSTVRPRRTPPAKRCLSIPSMPSVSRPCTEIVRPIRCFGVRCRHLNQTGCRDAKRTVPAPFAVPTRTVDTRPQSRRSSPDRRHGRRDDAGGVGAGNQRSR